MRSYIIAGFLMCSALAPLSAGAETAQDKIARAMSAAPKTVASAATIADMDANGKMTVLRKGTNGFTCFAGHPGVVGDDPMCGDAPSMTWMTSYTNKAKKPANTKPGIVYMLAGGTDWSADDPYATKGTPIKEPPHYMVMWPFDAKTSGFTTKASDTGTWIMYSGTPWAHLMVNGKP